MLITLAGVVEFNAGYVGLVHIKPLVDTEHAPEPLLENPKTSQLSSFCIPQGLPGLCIGTQLFPAENGIFPWLEAVAILLLPWKLLVGPFSSRNDSLSLHQRFQDH